MQLFRSGDAALYTQNRVWTHPRISKAGSDVCFLVVTPVSCFSYLTHFAGGEYRHRRRGIPNVTSYSQVGGHRETSQLMQQHLMLCDRYHADCAASSQQGCRLCNLHAKELLRRHCTYVCPSCNREKKTDDVLIKKCRVYSLVYVHTCPAWDQLLLTSYPGCIKLCSSTFCTARFLRGLLHLRQLAPDCRHLLCFPL